MEFLRNFYNFDVTGGKLVGERVLEDNWIEDFSKDVKRTTADARMCDPR
jgi:hypothetical protein